MHGKGKHMMMIQNFIPKNEFLFLKKLNKMDQNIQTDETPEQTLIDSMNDMKIQYEELKNNNNNEEDSDEHSEFEDLEERNGELNEEIDELKEVIIKNCNQFNIILKILELATESLTIKDIIELFKKYNHLCYFCTTKNYSEKNCSEYDSVRYKILYRKLNKD